MPQTENNKGESSVEKKCSAFIIEEVHPLQVKHETEKLSLKRRFQRTELTIERLHDDHWKEYMSVKSVEAGEETVRE